MIRCTSCGHVSEYTGVICPKCKEKYALGAEELADIEREVARAFDAKEFEIAAEGYRILADFGNLRAMREYGRILERGEIATRDLDLAMHYFGLAAEQCDPYSCFRYSRLVGRENREAAFFWLRFSAVIGCLEAYPVLAEELIRRGEDEAANYYLALAAAADDTDSIVTLAKRYAEGLGTPPSSAFAKWYLDKFVLPPINALRLAYQLRQVKAAEPPAPRHPSYSAMLHSLAHDARELGLHSAFCRIAELLSNEGDMSMRTALAVCYAEGLGVKADAAEAIDLLESAAVHGCAEAYRRLGDIYIAGKIVPRSPERALNHYRSAAEGGQNSAYEIMGDVYLKGELVERDIPEAIRLFDLAAREGVTTAREKAEGLRARREELALMAETASPEDAFRYLCISAGMGHIPAYRELGLCFLRGLGTEADRRRAYSWFLRAVEAGDTSALYPLGLCYSRGIGTAFDFDRAREVLVRAGKYGYTEAREELVRLLENKKRHIAASLYSRAMRLIYQKKFTEAKDTLELCDRLDHGKGIYTLGCMFEFGLGIPTERERAFALYDRAFSLRFRDPRAVYKLAVLKMSRRKD
ncbi:MAG: sel1 repeat family protein [Clostridia bacterium]|nr:sel1 repeat family protein [Clostridia bacterium]